MPITKTTRGSNEEVSYANAFWEIDPGSVGTWINTTHYGLEISPGTQSVETEDQGAFGGPPLVASSSRGSIAYSFTGVVTEETTTLFFNLLEIWNNATDERKCDFRYAPRDHTANAGTLILTSSSGKLTDFTPPAASAGTATVGQFSFTITAGEVTPSVST